MLAHDLLITKGGVALAKSHGLRQSIERHKGRLTSELTLARLRRKMPSISALKGQIDRASAGEEAKIPRWVRVNAIKSTIEEQLETTFSKFERTSDLQEVITKSTKSVMIDPHVPNLLAVTQGTDLSKTEAYTSGKIILQDKASCFPAYLLDPGSGDGDVVDACAAPGNKTTHLAAILHTHQPEFESVPQTIYACEKDIKRAQTLEKMVKIAGSKNATKIGLGQDFLQVKPNSERYKNVGALLLDPSCSGSGIVGRDSMPELHLPEVFDSKAKVAPKGLASKGKKRKAEEVIEKPKEILVDDDGNETVVKSEKDLKQRLDALAAFQILIVEHAFRFSAARKITYSTCSIHTEENENVVMQALQSDVARKRGWRILKRVDQVSGMRDWPVRGLPEACGGDKDISEGCIRSYKDDGRGVMGFFVAGFVRDGDKDMSEGPYSRYEDGEIVRDQLGMPILESTGAPVTLNERENKVEDEDHSAESESDASSDESSEDSWGGLDD